VRVGTNVTAMRTENSQSLFACIDGAMMEMVQGRHDEGAWKAALLEYFPKEDLLMPCSASYMPSEARPTCYSYIRARFLKEAGQMGKNAPLTPGQYAEAFGYCDLISESDVASRKSCYGSFGTYFGYLVNGSDDRTFPDMSDAQFLRVHELCGYAHHFNAQSACTLTAAGLVFSHGKGAKGAARFCEIAEDPTLRDRCFAAVVSLAFEYPEAAKYRTSVCASVPEAHREQCLTP